MKTVLLRQPVACLAKIALKAFLNKRDSIPTTLTTSKASPSTSILSPKRQTWVFIVMHKTVSFMHSYIHSQFFRDILS
jgi:hypothetical protein